MMRLIVEIDVPYDDEDLTLGQRVLIAGHVTRIEEERVDVAGYNAGRKYEESLAGEVRATFAHDAILTGRWEVRA